ncbi:MAG TPA: methyl-accepting chemotaxis protein [Anaerovoracaceae bacterium]|nr:methyl-accepting chemotaxis protein [Anaerovoracaceae bacterium]
MKKDQTKQRWKLGKRIRGGFTRITFVIIAMMLISIASSVILASFARGIYDGPYQRMVVVDQIELGLENLQRYLYTAISEDNPALINSAASQFDISWKTLDENIQTLKSMSTEEEIVEIDVFKGKVDRANDSSKRILTVLTTFDANNENENRAALVMMRGEAIPTFNSAAVALVALKDQSEKAAADYLRNATYAQILVIGFMAILLIISIVISRVVSKRLEKEITVPVEELVEVSTKLSRGETDITITYDKENELGVLATSMKGIVTALNNLIGEADSLTRSAVEGDLESRGDAEKFEGSYREIIQGVNNTLDALINPLKTAAGYMEQISKGQIPEMITEEARGEFNDINNSINTCIDAVNRLVEDTGDLVHAAIHGKLHQRAESSLHGGDFAKIINGVNKTIDTLVGHIDALPSPVMILNSDFEIQFVNKAGADAVGLSQEELAGTRCDDNFHIDGFNTENCACLKAMTQGEMAVGETSARLGEKELEISYTGIPLTDENEEIIGVLELIIDQTDIKNAARQAEKNVEIAKKQAEFQEQEVDQLIVNLEKLAAGDLSIVTFERETDDDTQRIGENFARINTYLNNCVTAIQALISDAGEMTKAALEGVLDHRADTSKHGGSFAMIMEGLNQTLDAVVDPIFNALGIMKAMEQGELGTQMEGDYQGDYAAVKMAMNQTIKNIQSYISEISSVLSEVAAGNLNLSITADYKGDFIEIKESLNNIIVTLSQVMGEISDAADQVSTGSRQVSDGSQTLSQGSTLQAGSIEELTSSISEIAEQTKRNAVNASQAHELANQVKENAEQGNVQMHGMLKSMEEINASSANISKIIKVIDDIAFQTNILALNAAVEAARAGQHGKGFAVVAEEVRNLAARSAAAARETTDLIEGSINKVKAGTKLANETASALNEIVKGIESAAGIVGDIANASNEQASAIALVNKGIGQVSEVVQNNSATAEESAAASEELSSQAELLKEMMARFQLNKGAKSLSGNHGQTRLLEEAVHRSHAALKDEISKEGDADADIEKDSPEMKEQKNKELKNKEPKGKEIKSKESKSKEPKNKEPKIMFSEDDFDKY